MRKALFFASTLLFMGACNNAGNTAVATDINTPADTLTTPEAIAYKHGLANWDAVNELAFTFNADRDTSHFERSWVWQPKQDRVTMVLGKDSISYFRNAVDSTLVRTDAAFINDTYWLLAPFKLVWDEGTKFSEKARVVAPISKDTMNRLTVTYVGEGGYTPGDAYDFFYDDTFMLREWIFRKGNDSLPTMTTTWEDYQDYDGLTLATEHADSLRKFKLYFTDISVKK